MNIFRTIRMRFITIYFTLVLSSLALIGVFILRSVESYDLGTIRKTMDDIAYVLSNELIKIENPADTPALIERIVRQQFEFGSQVEIFVLNAKSFEVVASTASYPELDSLDEDLLVQALNGKEAEHDLSFDNIAVKDRVYLSNSGKLMIYIRFDLRNHLSLIENSKNIIGKTIVIAIVSTSLISLLLSKSITDPIKNLTRQVKQLADGNFNQVIDVTTDDEIGEFSSKFNYLLSEINKRVDRLTEEKNKVETITNNIDEGLIAITNKGVIIHSNQKAYDLMGTVDSGEILDLYNDEKEDVIERKGKFIKLNFAEFTEQNEKGIIVAIQDITKQQQIEKMRKDFIADVSHELKTPLTSIISYAETIRDSAEMDEVTRTRFLAVIVSEAERMTRLVKDLLYLSAIDSAQQYLRCSNVRVKRIVRKCLVNMKLHADQKRQKIVFDKADDVEAYIDPDQIEQLILNILSNAIKYSTEESEIRIALENLGDAFRITIQDQGPGISEEDLKHIFDRFYRVDKARSRAMGGTGLGLAIAKGIVELHGGQIEAESVLGEGTSMMITIPFSGVIDN